MALFGRIVKALAFIAFMTVMKIRIAVRSSPEPFVRWLRSQPDPGLIPPSHIAEYEKRIRKAADVTYPSDYRANTLDIYWPAGGEDKLPTILWVHGGAFVAGDKAGTASWCAVMASQGYTVVSMNYETAPEARYPVPVLQMAEVVRYLTGATGSYPILDLGRLIIGGDSAGAQIASQFTAIQTNPELARLTGIQPSVSPGSLKAMLLYCGPYQVKRLANVQDRTVRFFMHQIGWAYIGERKWRDSVHAQHASTADYVTDRFPPAFITDGNTGSFETHGKELEERLRALGVPVASLFFPLAEGVVNHEYQFQLDTPEAAVCLDKTLAFLAECLDD